MDRNYAAETYGIFHDTKFLPVVEAALADGRLDGGLADDLKEAIRIANSGGPAGAFGKTMIGEVIFTIFCNSLPVPKARKKG